MQIEAWPLLLPWSDLGQVPGGAPVLFAPDRSLGIHFSKQEKVLAALT